MLSIAIGKEIDTQIIFNDSWEILNFVVYLDLKKYIHLLYINLSIYKYNYIYNN